MEFAIKVFLYAFIGIPTFAAIVAGALIWRGYVLAILWGWFMVPAFGAPSLGIPMAIGVSTVIGMLTTHRSFNEATDPKKQWMPLFAHTAGPALTLLVGWVVKQYI